jgi:hypothetical protein
MNIKDRLFLKKIDQSYTLHRIKDSILTIEGDSDFEIKGIQPFYKLSLTNCNEIFGIVDIERLAQNQVEKNNPDWECEFSGNIKGLKDFYGLGFNKAMELDKDKLFTIEDLEKAIIWAHDKSTEGVYLSRLPINTFILSFIKKEIDVEIEQINQLNIESGKFEWKNKLDENGCIILKKKEYVRS